MRRKFIAAVTSGVLALTVMAALPTHAEAVSIWLDLTPGTESVETVVLLSRKTPDDTIEVDLDLDELDITAAESKATYQEIKDYVLKEFGLKVSTLYISQIKRKCGIDVGEHYNISQKENQKVPQCPKEKEDAIRAALEHFAMI